MGQTMQRGTYCFLIYGEVLGVIREHLALVETLAFFSATVSTEIACSTCIAHAHAQGTHAARA